MSEDKVKYYTPSIEELFVGYECELKGWEDDITWYPTVLEQRMLSTIRINEVRTPYLTREQIESDGWIFEAGIGNNIKRYSKSYYIMTYDNEDYELIIMGKNDWSIFKGKCSSINELRKIQKLLEIK